MNPDKKWKTLFSMVIMLLMCILAVGTVVFAAGTPRSSSYNLVIRKVLAAGSPAEAYNKEYIFRIEGLTESGGRVEQVSREVTIKGAGTAEVDFSGPTAVTVVELKNRTDSINDTWFLTNTQWESSMYVPGLTHKSDLSISKPNGRITIRKGKDPALPGNTHTYVITGNNTDGAYEKIVRIDAGGEPYTLSGLPIGTYHVEELKAPAGFLLHVADTDVPIHEKKGTVTINGSGSLTVRAPQQPADTIYSFIVTGPDMNQIINVKAGETYTLDHLDAGEYSVEKYTGINDYTMTVSNKKAINGNTMTYSITKLTESSNWRVTLDADYATFAFDQWYNLAGNKAASGTKYMVRIEGIFEKYNKDTGVWEYLGKKAYNFIRTVPAKGQESINDYRLLRDPDRENKISFLVRINYNNKDNPIDTLQKFRLNVNPANYREGEEVTTTGSGTTGNTETITVGDTGRLTITKPEVMEGIRANEGTNGIRYRYQITGAGQYENSFMLSAGGSKTLTGLKPGQYTVTETVVWPGMDQEFSLAFEDVLSATTPNSSLSGTLLDEDGSSTITIEKRKGDPKYDKYGDNRDYHFRVTGPGNLNEIIELKAGGSNTRLRDLLGKENLPAGTYTITALDGDSTGFYLTFSDSSTVGVMGSSTAQVTVTNTYAKEIGSYHVVHEYYYRQAPTDPFEKWIPEGTNEIDSIGGQPIDDSKTYTSDEIRRLYMHNVDKDGVDTSYVYSYYDSVYGQLKPAADAHSEETEEETTTPVDGETETSTDEETGTLSVRETESGEDDETGSETGTEGTSGTDQEPETESGDKTETESETENHTGTEAESKAENHTGTETESETENHTGTENNARTKDSSKTDNGSKTKDDAGVENDSKTGPSVSYRPANRNASRPFVRPQPLNVSFHSGTEVRLLSNGQADGNSGFEGNTETGTVKGTESGSETGTDKATESGSEAESDRESESGSQTGSEKESETESPSGSKSESESETEKESGSLKETESDHESRPGESSEAPEETEAGAIPATETESETETESDSETESETESTQEPLLRYRNALRMRKSGRESNRYYDERDQYDVIDDKKFVTATEEGNQIIILRYVRDAAPVYAGSYKYVHEYYMRNNDGDQFEGRSAVMSSRTDLLLNNDKYFASGISKVETFQPAGHPQAHEYTHFENVYGFINTEGNDPLYRVDTNKNGVIATINGNQIIILRYYRQLGDPPIDVPETETETPVEETTDFETDPDPTPGTEPESEPDPDPDPDPDPPPSVPWTRPSEPETESETESTTETETESEPVTLPELPDPEDPDSPERVTIIGEDGVPRTYLKVWDPTTGKWIYILDEDVARSGLWASSGDHMNPGLWMLLGACSLCTVLVLLYHRRRRKTVESTDSPDKKEE